jgi:hypothetical protein
MEGFFSEKSQLRDQNDIHSAPILMFFRPFMSIAALSGFPKGS